MNSPKDENLPFRWKDHSVNRPLIWVFGENPLQWIAISVNCHFSENPPHQECVQNFAVLNESKWNCLFCITRFCSVSMTLRSNYFCLSHLGKFCLSMKFILEQNHRLEQKRNAQQCIYNKTSFLVQIKFITEDSKWFIYKY